jgi:hypothetical protein
MKFQNKKQELEERKTVHLNNSNTAVALNCMSFLWFRRKDFLESRRLKQYSNYLRPSLALTHSPSALMLNSRFFFRDLPKSTKLKFRRLSNQLRIFPQF